MKLRIVIAFVGLVAFIAAASRAEEKPADEKANTEARLLVAPTDGANVAAGQVLATFDTAANNWAVAFNDGSINFVTVTHGNLLGIDVAPVESPLRAHLDLKENQGVLVTNVPNESEAAKAGLKQHDVIVRLNDDAIEGPPKFNELVSAQQGKEVKLHILRQGKPTTLAVTLPNTPVYQLATTYFNDLGVVNFTDNQYRIGVTLAQADDSLRSQLRLAKGEGLVVTELVADSPAAKAGLKQHDLLTQLDGKRLTTVEDCNAQIQQIKDRKVTATLIRGGKETSVELSPQLSATQNINVTPYFGTVNFPDGKVYWQTNPATFVDVASNTLNPYVHWYAGTAMRGGTNAAASNATTSNAHQQIAALKQQLAAMQQSITALEAALQTPPADNPPKDDKQPQPQSEKK
jgi:membrane-associated protease RseP (regulator of RpoE activity)